METNEKNSSTEVLAGHNMKRNVTILIIILGLAALATLLRDYDRFFQFEPIRDEREHETGPYPAEWFMQQRLWPATNISTQEYLRASEQREHLNRNALDDPPNWLEAGPANIGGRVTDIVGDPFDEQIFYVAAATGGIFKTVDGGTTWTPIFDEQPSLSMGALTLDPNDSEVIYAATGESNSAGFTYFGTGVYRSTDGGAAWIHLGLTETKFIARIVVDPANSQKIVVAAMGDQYAAGPQRGIYLSTTGGDSWERLLFVNDSTGASDVLISPDDSNIMFAATWQRMRSASMRAVGGRGSGIYRTINGGLNWTRLTDGLPAPANDVGRIGLALCESSPNVMYAIYADDPGNFAGIYKSVDSGESWSRVHDDDLGGMYSNFGWYFGNIRVRPDNPNHVFALGQTLWRSTDGGQNWSEIGFDVHVDFHAMWISLATPQQSLVGCDGGVYRTQNNGNSFTFLNGLAINQFYAASVDLQQPQRRYGGVQDNGTLRTLTGNPDDWDQIHGGDGFYALVDPTNSQRIWAEYQWGWLERSEDGGQQWSNAMSGIDQSERTNWSTPVVLDPRNPQRLYYGATRLYRTDDRGDNWDAISPDLTDGQGGGNLNFGTITTIDVSPLDSQVLVVGTDDANIWISTNGGAQWHNRATGIPNRWVTRVVCDQHDARRFYVTVSGFRNAEVAAQLFVTDDEGRHWNNISGTLPDGPLNDVISDWEIPGRLYVGSDFGTYVTPDLGDHWFALGQGLPRVPVMALVYHPSRELTAATYGRSMYKADLFDLTLNQSPVIIASMPDVLDTVTVGASVIFSIRASDPDGAAIAYRWLHNDQEIGTDSTQTFAFADSGVTTHIVAEAFDGELTTRKQWYVYVAASNAVRTQIGVANNTLLLRAYPNPFNATATLEFTLPAPAETVVRLYDESGRLAKEFARATLPSGTHRLWLDARNLSSGVYFAELRADNRHVIHKLLLLK
jgi:photosystem II stability/assembly factor-like uncharacterized protein